MLGFYENFPEGIHKIENFTSALQSRKLQQRLITVLSEINCKTFSFEEIANPTVPECTIIFEVGIADSESFNYIDAEETKRALNALKNEPFRVLNFYALYATTKLKRKKERL